MPTSWLGCSWLPNNKDLGPRLELELRSLVPPDTLEDPKHLAFNVHGEKLRYWILVDDGDLRAGSRPSEEAVIASRFLRNQFGVAATVNKRCFFANDPARCAASPDCAHATARAGLCHCGVIAQRIGE